MSRRDVRDGGHRTYVERLRVGAVHGVPGAKQAPVQVLDVAAHPPTVLPVASVGGGVEPRTRRPTGTSDRPSAPFQRRQWYGVVVDTFTKPARSSIGREYSVESLLISVLPMRSADLARADVSAR